jgi:hypothetical protein
MRLDMPEFCQTICPLWFRVPKGYELEGSGVLLEICRRRFLLTAAHVIDKARDGPLHIGLPKGYVKMAGVSKVTTAPHGDRQADHVDLAFVAIDDDVANEVSASFAFLPVVHVDVLDEGTEGTLYVVNGCPWKKVLKDGRTFRPNLYELKLAGRRPQDYPPLGLSPETHIAMEFDHKKMINGLGRRVESPKLNGVSGGPVWRALRVDHPSGKPALTKRLSGIVIEHRKEKRTLVATRVAGVLAGIAHTFPELAQFIPHNPKMEIVCRGTRESFR